MERCLFTAVILTLGLISGRTLAGVGKTDTVSGDTMVLTALSDSKDYTNGVSRLPTAHKLVSDKLERIDFLKVATDFADCMLKFGRDRYGEVHSPLFAVLLTREAEPKIGPEPYFDRPSPYDTSNMNTPFIKYDFNRCLNYPAGLGSEGPHKVTLTGCDVYEDRDLYSMLIDLSRITGNAKYRLESQKALRWWFTNTMGPAGLYPWGEHLGWDFEYECPTYFKGPSKYLYAACYHEIKDEVPFIDLLATLPASQTGERTPLEKYAFGVWNAHYWDKKRAIYCRHGDYTGQDNREGSPNGFPAHQGAHLQLWLKTVLVTKDPEVKRQMEDILNRVLDVQIARAKKYGFIPFTFRPELEGKPPKRSGQSDRLARHAAELSVVASKEAPAISAKLRQMAKLLMGEEKFDHTIKNFQMFRATGDRGYLQGIYDSPSAPPVTVADVSGEDKPAAHGDEIIKRLRWYKHYKDVAYLNAAEQQARIAYAMFCDDTCPLPKAYARGHRKTVAGDTFPDFYFRGAKLMYAFALLGDALEQNAEEQSARSSSASRH